MEITHRELQNGLNKEMSDLKEKLKTATDEVALMFITDWVIGSASF